MKISFAQQVESHPRQWLPTTERQRSQYRNAVASRWALLTLNRVSGGVNPTLPRYDTDLIATPFSAPTVRWVVFSTFWAEL
jgi:hypothetical protein